MLRLKNFVIAIMVSFAALAPAWATNLVMVSQPGCHWCETWEMVIGPIYPKTDIAEFAPLIHADLRQGPPEGITYVRRVNFTPTFILIQDGVELARIEGYLGEDLFWMQLEKMMLDKTDFRPNSTQ